MVEWYEILLNPACAFDELGQCGGGPEVQELGHEGSGELVAQLSDGGTCQSLPRGLRSPQTLPLRANVPSHLVSS